MLCLFVALEALQLLETCYLTINTSFLAVSLDQQR